MSQVRKHQLNTYWIHVEGTLLFYTSRMLGLCVALCIRAVPHHNQLSARFIDEGEENLEEAQRLAQDGE